MSAELDSKGLAAARSAYLKLEHDFYKPVENVVRAYLTASDLSDANKKVEELTRERDRLTCVVQDWKIKHSHIEAERDAIAAELEKYKTWFEMKSKSNAEALGKLSQANLDNAVLRELVRSFVLETIDYATRNNLGDPEKQHNVKWARAPRYY